MYNPPHPRLRESCYRNHITSRAPCLSYIGYGYHCSTYDPTFNTEAPSDFHFLIPFYFSERKRFLPFHSNSLPKQIIHDASSWIKKWTSDYLHPFTRSAFEHAIGTSQLAQQKEKRKTVNSRKINNQLQNSDPV